MSHHNHPAMLSSREVANFRAFIASNPHLIGRRSPRGAFDAMPPDLDLTRGLPPSAFQSGGSFDMEEVESAPQLRAQKWDPMPFLRYLAKKLSKEDWTDLHRLFRGEEEHAEDDLPDLSKLPTNGIERAMAADAAFADATLAEAQRLAPGFGHIKIDGAPMATVHRGVAYDSGDIAKAAEIAPGFERIKIGAPF